MRVVVAEDSVLFREGLVRLLLEAGYEVVAAVGDAPALLEEVAQKRPDILIADIRMPPHMLDDGVLAATQLRVDYPELPMVLLSQHVETRHLPRASTVPSGSG